MFSSFLLSKSSEDICHELHHQKAIYSHKCTLRGEVVGKRTLQEWEANSKGEAENDGLIVQ